jgi:hypothetical protein
VFRIVALKEKVYLMFSENIKNFFDVQTGFAESAYYQGVKISLIVDEQYHEVNLGEHAIGSKAMVAYAANADVLQIVQGHRIIIGSAVYEVAEVDVDRTGITALKLERVENG